MIQIVRKQSTQLVNTLATSLLTVTRVTTLEKEKRETKTVRVATTS